MAKITNLKGTTWRLDGNFAGLAASYGVFDIDGSLVLEGYDTSGNLVGSFTYGVDVFWCGYTPINNYGEATADSVCLKVTVDGSDVFGLVPLRQEDDGAILSYLLTFTGGTDISNAQFIDFINTYGTLVSGGEPPTADSVKSKLQSLLTASNAKTGKSDANLTDAVKTLLEGYGQGGGGGGECSGNHIIEVDELPEVGVEGAYYALRKIENVFMCPTNDDGNLSIMSFLHLGGIEFIIKQTPTELQQVIPQSEVAIGVVAESEVVYTYSENGWQLADPSGEMDFVIIYDWNDIVPSFTKTYVLLSTVLYEYKNGAYKVAGFN